VEEGWNFLTTLDKSFTIDNKITAVSTKLQSWSKNNFKRADREISKLKKILTLLKNNNLLDTKEIKYKINELWI